jgi:hypothetical protein
VALQVFLLLALGMIPVQSASFQTNSIEGWATLVNERLLVEDKAATERALELLQAQLKICRIHRGLFRAQRFLPFQPR